MRIIILLDINLKKMRRIQFLIILIILIIPNFFIFNKLNIKKLKLILYIKYYKISIPQTRPRHNHHQLLQALKEPVCF